MWQELAVAALVLVAAVYVGAKYLPAAWRVRIVNRLSKGGADSKLVRWLDTGGSCGSGCSSCNSCETPAEPTPPADSKHRVIKIHQK
ncbi:hypothetical protein QPK31_25310 [Massilia sp. YIM B02769]|jgi:hypothetical protein|uniref:DUF6587 family protein n=1 Tax=Massilia sp. YIM B02769 TaxID=3050129 RepID=UPI0025B66773|nr:DUF6587 family protein [Massilia sp. YIM B02769]MDN4061547.1 hypothetical protein [Massilia sp. YIM B02769]